jgi:hypothetical protein
MGGRQGSYCRGRRRYAALLDHGYHLGDRSMKASASGDRSLIGVAVVSFRKAISIPRGAAQ